MGIKPQVIEDQRYVPGYHIGDYWKSGYYETYTRLETQQETEERNMSRRTFRLLKDTDFLKAGTIVQEACDDGDQAYVVLDFEDAVLFDDFEEYEIESHHLSRGAVEDNPEWYEEVELTWVTKVKQAVTRVKNKKGKK